MNIDEELDNPLLLKVVSENPSAPNYSVTFEITFNVTDPAAMRAAALRCYLAAGSSEEQFVENERSEDKIEDTPVGVWLLALFDHPREYGPGFDEYSHRVDSSEFYQPPP